MAVVLCFLLYLLLPVIKTQFYCCWHSHVSAGDVGIHSPRAASGSAVSRVLTLTQCGDKKHLRTSLAGEPLLAGRLSRLRQSISYFPNGRKTHVPSEWGPEHFTQPLIHKEHSELEGLKNQATGQSTDPKITHQGQTGGNCWFSCCKYPRWDLILHSSTILAGRGPGGDVEVHCRRCFHHTDMTAWAPRTDTTLNAVKRLGSDELLSISSLCFECHHLFSCRRTELSFNAGSIWQLVHTISENGALASLSRFKPAPHASSRKRGVRVSRGAGG